MFGSMIQSTPFFFRSDVMDFEQELSHVASTYASQGYEVTIRPAAECLPPCAKDFKIEILGRRGDGGVIVAVKKDRDQVASDANLAQYAGTTSSQKGWRFDLAIVESEQPNTREIDGAAELSEEDIEKSFDESLELTSKGFHRPAIITAWAGFEAAMRLRLRAEGEQAGWGSSPTSMLNELYSTGIIDASEYARLRSLALLRNQIVHGFASPDASQAGTVPFIGQVGRRLVMESQKGTLTASS